MTREIWYAQDGEIWISGPGFYTGSDYTSQVKEISITGGGRDVDGQRCFGSGANYHVFEKGQEMIEASITTVKKNNYLSFAINGGSTEAPMLSTGDAVRQPITIFYKFNDRFDVSGAAVAIKLGTAFITSREMSLAVDDHMEETFSIKAAPSNYQEQYTDNRITTPLTLVL